jgi:hypothetical protein
MGKTGGFENGQRIGGVEALAERFDANQRRAGGIGHRVSL